MGMGAMVLPDFLNSGTVDPLQFLNEGADAGTKKVLANIALNAARAKGAARKN